jgi:hypothetical protein
MTASSCAAKPWRGLLALALLAFAGCGYPQGRLNEARALLVEGLEAWKAGARPESLTGSSQAIEFEDEHWSRGVRLVSYEVLRVYFHKPEQMIRCEAQLTLSPRGGAERVERPVYNVVLGSPVRIFSNPMP